MPGNDPDSRLIHATTAPRGRRVGLRLPIRQAQRMAGPYKRALLNITKFPCHMRRNNGSSANIITLPRPTRSTTNQDEREMSASFSAETEPLTALTASPNAATVSYPVPGSNDRSSR